MTSSELKTLIMGNFLFGKSFIGLFTECWGNSDVLGVRKSLFVVEYEIKVSANDLRRELRTVRSVLNQEEYNDSKHSSSKFDKHKKYLYPSTTYFGQVPGFKQYRPNQFYFVVPSELETIAIKSLLNTPYGLITYGKVIDSYLGERNDFKEVIRAKYIHKDKIGLQDLVGILRKAATELFFTRKKLLVS